MPSTIGALMRGRREDGRRAKGTPLHSSPLLLLEGSLQNRRTKECKYVLCSSSTPDINPGQPPAKGREEAGRGGGGGEVIESQIFPPRSASQNTR